MQKKSFLFIIILSQYFFLNAQTSNDYKAVVVLNILKHIQWTNDYKQGRFVINVWDNQGDTYKNIKAICEKKKLPQMSHKIKVRQVKSLDKIRASQVIYIASDETKTISKISSLFPKAIIISEDKGLFHQGSHINLEIQNNQWHYRHNSKKLENLGLFSNDIFEKLSLNNVKKDNTQAEFERYRNEKNAELTNLQSKLRELEDFKSTSDWVQKDVLDLLKNITYSLDIEESVKDSLIQLLEAKTKVVEIKNTLKKLESEKIATDEKVKEANNIIKNTQKQVRNQKVLIWLVLIALLSVVSIAFYLDNRKKKKHLSNITKSKEEIEKKNKNLQKNILSAQLIQNAMLPSQNLIKSYLPNHFILYRPQDIVSGDFYWFTTKDDDIFLAVVDCTGHGVQGAFMSMIANEVLHKIVHMKNVTKPSDILTHLHLDIRKALKQDNENGNSDGMDISLCKIVKRGKIWKLEYAGGKNMLLYVQNQEMKSIRGNRFSIGGYQQGKNRVFTNQELSIEEDTTLYLFSDGYYDQLGGGHRKRITKQYFEQLLLENANLTFAQQKVILEDFLATWIAKDALHQLDDILLIGLKLEVENG